MLERFHPDAVLAEARPQTPQSQRRARPEMMGGDEEEPEESAEYARSKRRLSPIKRELKNYVNDDSSESRVSDIEVFINQRIEGGHRPNIMTVPGTWAVPVVFNVYGKIYQHRIIKKFYILAKFYPKNVSLPVDPWRNSSKIIS